MTVAAAWEPEPGPRTSAEAAPPDQWWGSFNDPALNRLIAIAYQQNLPLQVAGLRIAQARAQLEVANGRQFPEILAVGNATAIGLSKNIPYVSTLSSSQRHFVDFQVGFDAGWEADLWGKYRRAVEADTASLAASRADYDFALVSLTAEVARSYAVVRTYEVLIAQAEENINIQEEGLRIAESRVRNGATSELDVAQATTLLQSTRASVPHLRISLQGARNALGTLLGQPAGGLDELLAGPTVIPTPPATIAIGIPAELLRRRPDIRSAEQQAAAQSARVGVAEADLYPMFSLTGSVGLETTTATNLDDNLGDGLYYRVGPQLVWRALDFGRARNKVRVEDARYQQLLVDYQDAVLKAAQEVQDALSGFENAENAIVFEQNAVKSAQRAVELAMIQYREGATDYQRVLDAQRSLLDKETTLSQTRSTAATSVIALYKALGGGWQSFQGEPIHQATQQEMKQRTDWSNLLTAPAAPAENQTEPGRP